jgi:hypothetical protein
LKEFYGFSGVIWGVILGERDYISPRFKVKKFFHQTALDKAQKVL